MPVTKLAVKSIGRADLNRYTHLVVPSYNGNLLGKAKEKISAWIKNGGHLIVYRDAVKWANKAKLIEEKFRESDLTAEGVAFVDKQKFKEHKHLEGLSSTQILIVPTPLTLG